jgi:acyl-CoA thioesterase II
MHIDELIDLTRQYINTEENRPMLSISKDWTQGRTAFGGISAAMIYTAIKEKVTEDRVLRSYTVNFVGPLNPDQPFDIEVEILRQGKNATQAIAKAIQDGKVAVLCQACFGVARESKIEVKNTDKHTMPFPQKANFLPQIPKVTPKFLRHLDLASIEGGLPFTGSKKSHIHGWMRFTKAPQKITDAHLIALIDAWPPTTLQMLRWPAPASTMCWNIDFIHPHVEVSPTDWFAYQAHTRQAAFGYGHTEANIWDSRGELVAISRQTVALFDS